MILQKLAAAIRRQDWFQIVIEVLIVIVGIFLGLQVQAAYEERAERKQELVYLDNLRKDITVNIETVKILFDQREVTRKKLNEVAYYLSEVKPDIVLTKEHCTAIGESHRINNFARERQALLEIQSSGQIANFQNDQIRYLFSLYARSIYGLDDLIGEQNTRESLNEKYPEIIKIINNIRQEDVVTDQSLFSLYSGVEYKCDFTAIKENPSFHNDLMIIDTTYVFYLMRGHNQLMVMQELLEELDSELEVDS
ncbi:MAG: hypothetical protein H6912_06710 [Kordiimonadaceae bacterium]|nr:hypothetical protein [Kordiimonadaceae bacterium]